MEKLLILGETSRKVSTFGTPVLKDEQERMYQKIERRYDKLLQRDSRFNYKTMRAFDFKLKRAKGREWPEPPGVGDVITFISTLGDDIMCSGIVSYIHLGRKRSVGIVYLDEWEWYSETVPDFTN